MELGLPNQNMIMNLTVDYNEYVYACCLWQQEGEKVNVIGFGSTIQTPAQQNYVKLERIFDSTVWAMRHFKPYLRSKFKLEAKDKSISKLKKINNPTNKVAMW